MDMRIGTWNVRSLYRVEDRSWRNRMSGMDWIGQAQDRDRWKAVVNVIMNLGAP
jgi:hypothetical protein